MIKVILNENLCQINKQQNRNNRPYLNWQFITAHPYLRIVMVMTYLLTAILIYHTSYFGLYWTIGFTLFFFCSPLHYCLISNQHTSLRILGYWIYVYVTMVNGLLLKKYQMLRLIKYLLSQLSTMQSKPS